MLKQKWVITLIGVLALSILIWFGGPYIAIADKKFLESDVVRLLIEKGAEVRYATAKQHVDLCRPRKADRIFVWGVRPSLPLGV